MVVEPREDGRLDVAADILEIDVDARRAGAIERGAEAGLAMVEAGIEAQRLDDVAALVRPAGNADRAGAGDLRELANDGADRARGGGGDQRLALLRPADRVEPNIGGEPRHAEHAERRRERRFGRIELVETLAGDGAVALPALAAQHEIAGAHLGAARANDLADIGGLH